MNIVKAIKLAKKRKMGFVRKGSYEHRTGCYMYPTNIIIYKIALYLPKRDEYIRFWNPMADDITAKDWILVKPTKSFFKAYSSEELKLMGLGDILLRKEDENEIQSRN